LDHDEKRLHSYQELRHAEEGWLAATCETLTLHIDMSGPKVTPFPADVLERIAAMRALHEDLPEPVRAGRSIAIRRQTR
ncbi:MAG: thioesterase, partial [Nitratireductor sp.]